MLLCLEVYICKAAEVQQTWISFLQSHFVPVFSRYSVGVL